MFDNDGTLARTKEKKKKKRKKEKENACLKGVVKI